MTCYNYANIRNQARKNAVFIILYVLLAKTRDKSRKSREPTRKVLILPSEGSSISPNNPKGPQAAPRAIIRKGLVPPPEGPRPPLTHLKGPRIPPKPTLGPRQGVRGPPGPKCYIRTDGRTFDIICVVVVVVGPPLLPRMTRLWFKSSGACDQPDSRVAVSLTDTADICGDAATNTRLLLTLAILPGSSLVAQGRKSTTLEEFDTLLDARTPPRSVPCHDLPLVCVNDTLLHIVTHCIFVTLSLTPLVTLSFL